MINFKDSQKNRLLLKIGLFIVLLDQLTKGLIVHFIPLNTSLPILPGYFDLVHYRNSGAAFGLWANWPSPGREIFFFAISVVALLLFLYHFYETTTTQRGLLISLILILSGALGNVVDRVFRGNVVDFLSFHWQNQVSQFSVFGKHYFVELNWPAFNVADSAITIGVLLLIWTALVKKS